MMKVEQLTTPSAGVCTLTLTADAAEFEAAVEAAYQAHRAEYTLEGCAKGEADRAAIEAKEGVQYFYYEGVNALLGKETDALLDATFTEAGVTPLTPPESNLTRCDKDGVSIDITVGVLPPVTLGQWKGICIEYPRLAYPPQAIDGQLEMLRHRVAAQKGTPQDLPALDDAFAALFECETLAALREKMDAALQEMIDKKSYQQATFMLLEEIGKLCTAECPALLLDAEMDNAMRNLHDHLAQNKIALDDYLAQIGQTAESFEAERRIGAERALRGKFAMHAIAKELGITASPIEVESELVRLSAKYGRTVSDFMAETPAYMVRNELILYRTLDAVCKENTLKEQGKEQEKA